MMALAFLLWSWLRQVAGVGLKLQRVPFYNSKALAQVKTFMGDHALHVKRNHYDNQRWIVASFTWLGNCALVRHCGKDCSPFLSFYETSMVLEELHLA